MDTAQAANEQTYNLGTPDFCLSAELEDFAAEQEAEDERLEAEGRAEMNYTLLGEWGA